MSYVAKRNGFTIATSSNPHNLINSIVPHLSPGERASYAAALRDGGSVQVPTDEGMAFASVVNKTNLQKGQVNSGSIKESIEELKTVGTFLMYVAIFIVAVSIFN